MLQSGTKVKFITSLMFDFKLHVPRILKRLE